MANIKELQEQELEEITTDNIIDLETLILDGANARIPIQVDYPKADGTTVPVTARIRPLTSVEANNANRKGLSPKSDTTSTMEILKYGLYTKDDKPFPVKLIKQMPSGVVNAIAEKILEISGVKIDKEENARLVKDLMGF